MIRERVKEILKGLPPGVELVGAAKTRSPEEILEAIEGGLTIVGENYVQEAERAFAVVGDRVKWHMIGRLQTNKVKKAVRIFDMIETLDSRKLAEEIDRSCEKSGKVMPVLVEINSGGEPGKSGILPEEGGRLITDIARLEHVRVMGLMTMGPLVGSAEDSRPYFRKTRSLFEELRGMDIAGVEMTYLSMGMSDSFRVAVEEGANMIRVGTWIFGKRVYRPS